MQLSIGERPQGRVGHICSGTNVRVLDQAGNTVGFLTPEAADEIQDILDWLAVERGEV